MDSKTPFEKRLELIPWEWKGPLVDVIDTIETVQMGLKSIGIDDPFVLMEAVRLVIDRYNKAEAAEFEQLDE